MSDRSRALLEQAKQARRDGRVLDAHRDFLEAVVLCRQTSAKRDLIQALTGLGQIERDLGRGEAARPLHEEAVTICRGEDDPPAFTILMLWSRPAAIPAWAVWAAVAAQAVVWVSTVTIQVPIQLQLSNHGLSIDLIERLIETNFWLRRIPYAICAGLFLWMAAQVIGASGERLAA